MEGFFELKTAADLLAKLRREHAKLEANPLDSDSLFNFMVTAGTLLDWAYPGRTNEAERGRLRQAHPVLGTCSHLNNQAKHFRLDRPGNCSVTGIRRQSTSGNGFVGGGFEGGGFAPSIEMIVDLVELRGDTAKQLGQSIVALDLARQVLAFWDAYPLDEAGLITPDPAD